MGMSPKLEQRQVQGLVMTPQLQQAIKLLQLSNLELSSYDEQELERNPMLERQDGDGEPAPNGVDAAPEAAVQRDATVQTLDGITPPDGDGIGSAGAIDADRSDLYADESPADVMQGGDGASLHWSEARGGGGGGSGDGEFGLEQTLTRTATLKERLGEQLAVAALDPVGRLIGAHVLELIDDTGYLTEDAATIAGTLGTDPDRVERVIRLVQTFEPSGVCARSLKECLEIQLRERDRLDPAMQALLDRLDLLARHDLPQLMRLCGVDAEDLRDMIGEIRALDPKPGLAYDFEVAQPVVPDVFVRESPSGGWTVELNADTLPRLLVNTQYFAKVSAGNREKAVRGYLTECMNNANWLVKSLDQRARTILKVASELVRQQDAFLVHGVQYLRPLNLKAIADAIGMHESTVSRVTANKYMATPRGVFELRYFFTSAIASSEGGEAHSAEAVRQRIRDLIEREDPKEVLSDDRIVEILNDGGIDIARRTVAKYREGMGIPSSVQRRRMKRLSA